jgi:hypothetical protein
VPSHQCPVNINFFNEKLMRENELFIQKKTKYCFCKNKKIYKRKSTQVLVAHAAILAIWEAEIGRITV